MIALITPTGARPRQMQLCARYMQRQTFAGDVVWVIVDDCQPLTTEFITDDFRAGWHIMRVHPRPPWHEGQNTQGRNLIAAVNALLKAYRREEITAIGIIEDDDYYKAHYLQTMTERIAGYQLAGETHTVYYNVQYRRWHENQNAAWSSLFQTFFTPAVLPQFTKLYSEKFIDYALFRLVTERVNLFRTPAKLAIGIKGMCGRTGIGAGHRFTTYLRPDYDMLKLKEFIGEDYRNYVDDWDSCDL